VGVVSWCNVTAMRMHDGPQQLLCKAACRWRTKTATYLCSFVSFTHHQLFPSSPRAIMSTSTSHPDFTSFFNTALQSYQRKTKKDLASHPLLPRFQSCDSAEAILFIFREQISAFNKTEVGYTKWVIPTVKVLHASSDILGRAVGLVNIKISLGGHVL
jgi:hypothetical protein